MLDFKNLKTEQKLLFGALGAGFLAMILAYVSLAFLENRIKAKMEPIKVITAAKYIPAWAEITENMVEFKEIPKNFLTSAHVTDFKKLKGQKTLVPFTQGEPILINKLTLRGESLNAAIPTGLRAVSVAVDEVSGVAYMIKAGDFVDILLTYEMNEEKKTYTISATLLQAAQVIAVGTASSAGVTDASYSTVTLALTPEEAELLAFAKERGKITLALRPIGDMVKEKVKPVSFGEFIKQLKTIEKGEEEIKKSFISTRVEAKPVTDAIEKRTE
ncbi:MAG: Flp pilus assembly protein CpaB [bacterium]